MPEHVADLLAFIDRSPTPYHAVAESVHRLAQEGYRQLSEVDAWQLEPGARRYVVRNDGSLAAFEVVLQLVAYGVWVAGEIEETGDTQVSLGPSSATHASRSRRLARQRRQHHRRHLAPGAHRARPRSRGKQNLRLPHSICRQL